MKLKIRRNGQAMVELEVLANEGDITIWIDGDELMLLKTIDQWDSILDQLTIFGERKITLESES